MNLCVVHVVCGSVNASLDPSQHSELILSVRDCEQVKCLAFHQCLFCFMLFYFPMHMHSTVVRTMAWCLSISVMCWDCTEMAEWVELVSSTEATLGVSYILVYGNSVFRK